MWVFTQYGFFSIVHKDSDEHHLLVRARFRGDLERLRKKEPRLGRTIETEDADYRFRAFIPREAAAELFAGLMRELMYGNFKEHAAEFLGNAHLAVYHDVWEVTRKAQDARKRNERRRPGRKSTDTTEADDDL
jgi:hypothetical protein